MGIITIHWPIKTDPDRYDGVTNDVKKAIKIAREYGMNHRFTSSSCFIEWDCDIDTATQIKTEVENTFPKLSVVWRER